VRFPVHQLYSLHVNGHNRAVVLVVAKTSAWPNVVHFFNGFNQGVAVFDLAIDSVKPIDYRRSSQPALKDVCTMCGEYCSIKAAEKCLNR